MSVALPLTQSGYATPLSLRDKLQRRFSQLKSQRTGDGWDSHWRQISDVMRPRRSRFMLSDVNKGSRINQKIIDNTGVIASNVLASGMMNGMSSPAQQWFKYEPNDLALLDHGPSREWISQLERVVARIFHSSNVYESLPLIYDELGLFGTGCAVVEDDFNDVLRLATFTVGEYAIAVNKRRSVDTLYREMRMTALNVVMMFGLNKCSHFVKNAYDTSNYDSWVDICHAIEPNDERDAGKEDNQNMAYRSIYWEPNASGPDKNQILRKSGYRENPIIAPRWSVIGNDVYGRSPGMDALGDVNQLQIQHKRKGEAIDKQVNPPTQGPPSSADRFISRLPGQHNIVNDLSQGGVKPLYDVAPNINGMIEDIADTRQRVREAFFVNAILAISQMEGVQPRNQWEISERKGEALSILGPVIERLQNELLSPLHKRAISRVMDVSTPFWQQGLPGMLPPPPPELQGMPLQVTYISQLALAQKQGKISAMQAVASQAAQLAPVFPEVRAKFDAQQYMDELQDAIGAPPKIIRSDEQVAALNEQQAQQEQMARTAQAMPAMRDGAEALKALGEAPVGQGKGALQTVLEQMGAGPGS